LALKGKQDLIKRRGAAAFGTRLRRLSDLLDRQVQALYRSRGVEFEPRWFPVVTMLSEHGPLSVGELASLIGITHAAVSQVRRDLVRHRIVKSTTDSGDARRQILALTPKGAASSMRLRPIWSAVAAATEDLWSEASPGFLKSLDRIEAALEREPMDARAKKILSKRKGRG
jgi:MarR family transcriptional regulator, organic hydroperoxide resistance regulator